MDVYGMSVVNKRSNLWLKVNLGKDAGFLSRQNKGLQCTWGRDTSPVAIDGDAWLPWLHSEMLIYTCDLL